MHHSVVHTNLGLWEKCKMSYNEVARTLNMTSIALYSCCWRIATDQKNTPCIGQVITSTFPSSLIPSRAISSLCYHIDYRELFWKYVNILPLPSSDYIDASDILRPMTLGHYWQACAFEAQPCRYCIYSVVQILGFRSAGATHYPDKGEIWQEGAAPPPPNFTFIGAEMWEYSPQNYQIFAFWPL